jgi:hypothetical protein
LIRASTAGSAAGARSSRRARSRGAAHALVGASVARATFRVRRSASRQRHEQ